MILQSVIGDRPFDKIILILDTYKTIFFVSALSYFFVYGFEVTHFTLSIDEEFLNNFQHTLSLGRWGHALLKKYLLPEPYIPFFSVSFCLLTLALSTTLSALYLKTNKTLSYLFVIMMAAFPQLAYQIQFENQVDTISIAFLFSTLSNIILSNTKKSSFFVFIFFNVIAESIYQSIFLYGFSLFLLSLSLRSLEGKVSFNLAAKKIFQYLLLISISVAINHEASILCAMVYGVEISDYLSTMIGWGSAPPLKVAKHVIRSIKHYFSFKTFYGLNSYFFSLFWIGSAILAMTTKKPKNYKVTICVLIFLLLSSFSLHILMGSEMVPRAMVQLPIVFSGAFIIFTKIFKVNTFSLLSALIFLFVGSAASNKLFYSDYMAREADNNEARQIVSLIQSRYPEFNEKTNPVFFYGSMSPNNVWRVRNADVFGASFFEWDGGNNERIRNFIKISNIADFLPPDIEQKKMIISKSSSIPSWPDRKSVQMVEGVIVVKLSNIFNEKIN